MDYSIALATCAEIFQHCPTIHAREEKHTREGRMGEVGETGGNQTRLTLGGPLTPHQLQKYLRSRHHKHPSVHFPWVTTVAMLNEAQWTASPNSHRVDLRALKQPESDCWLSLPPCKLINLLAIYHCNLRLLILVFKVCRLWPSSPGEYLQTPDNYPALSTSASSLAPCCRFLCANTCSSQNPTCLNLPPCVSMQWYKQHHFPLC